MEMITKKLMVYGTLKKGHGLHNYMSSGTYVGEGILSGFKMFSNGSYPMIIEGEGEVSGEIYEFDTEEYEKVISTLDLIEWGYDRTEAIVECNDKPMKVEVYIYKNVVEDCPVIENGIWI